MTELFINLGLGALLGLVGGLLGIGGGLIAIPVLGMLYGMDQHLAQGTALVMITPNVLIGFYRYHQKHAVDLRAVSAMAVFSMAATWIAAKFATSLDPRTLHVAFALFLVALALYFGLRRGPATPHPAAAKKMPRAALPLLGIACGLMSGVFTIGGGLVIVPALISLFGMQQTRAQGMALALVVPSSVVALFGYAQGGHVDWATGVPLALGGVATVSLGVMLAHRFSPLRLRLLFCAVLLGTAAMMLISST
ncbi:hypothetical protein SAMN05216204_103114 [Massilia yuzhufengensis]|uniref:Probable membrane transporter protein n=1 Tax=Massilia yuzhufengensis TaxID=1164594 RepID=A0A1I1FWL2_9BURK|nr:sulfite exporter TauE/SafE family protein [Massilia yuzhufengensis]SFC03426.1 hypothetical protein SAMN05216204_103114 [Massilia yuzhufengensis]